MHNLALSPKRPLNTSMAGVCLVYQCLSWMQNLEPQSSCLTRCWTLKRQIGSSSSHWSWWLASSTQPLQGVHCIHKCTRGSEYPSGKRTTEFNTRVQELGTDSWVGTNRVSHLRDISVSGFTQSWHCINRWKKSSEPRKRLPLASKALTCLSTSVLEKRFLPRHCLMTSSRLGS